MSYGAAVGAGGNGVGRKQGKDYAGDFKKFYGATCSCLKLMGFRIYEELNEKIVIVKFFLAYSIL